jgi:hypothetical protein
VSARSSACPGDAVRFYLIYSPVDSSALYLQGDCGGKGTNKGFVDVEAMQWHRASGGPQPAGGAGGKQERELRDAVGPEEFQRGPGSCRKRVQRGCEGTTPRDGDLLCTIKGTSAF